MKGIPADCGRAEEIDRKLEAAALISSIDGELSTKSHSVPSPPTTLP